MSTVVNNVEIAKPGKIMSFSAFLVKGITRFYGEIYVITDDSLKCSLRHFHISINIVEQKLNLSTVFVIKSGSLKLFFLQVLKSCWYSFGIGCK